MRALIDGDILLYSIGSFTNPHPFLKDKEGKPVMMPCSTEAIHGFVEEHLAKIVEGAECDDYTVYISGPTNFRNDVAVTHPYKFKRKDNEKPYHYQTVKDYLCGQEYTFITDGNEADDAMALAQTKETVICTIDKDLDMVPGLHFNWRKDLLYSQDINDAHMWFCLQLLTGDWSTDSIIGCGHVETKTYGAKAKKAGQQYDARVGIGEKAALNMIGHLYGNDRLKTVALAYEKEFGTEWQVKMNEMGTLLAMGVSADDQWAYEDVIALPWEQQLKVWDIEATTEQEEF